TWSGPAGALDRGLVLLLDLDLAVLLLHLVRLVLVPAAHVVLAVLIARRHVHVARTLVDEAARAPHILAVPVLLRAGHPDLARHRRRDRFHLERGRRILDYDEIPRGAHRRRGDEADASRESGDQFRVHVDLLRC